MPEIEETPLPGVGLRVEFVSEEGQRVGVVHHRTGMRELFACEPSDPDSVSFSLRLSDDEGHALADALGGSTVVENLTDAAQHVEGLTIDWVTVAAGSPYDGRTIGDARVRTRTGVSVVAVIRNAEAFPAPGPDFLVESHDTLLIVGTAEGAAAVRDLLTVG